MASKKTTKKTCAADGKSAMQNDDILNILSSALGINADKLKEAIEQVNKENEPNKLQYIHRVNLTGKFGTKAIRYSAIKSGEFYRENGFFNENGQFIPIKRTREYLTDDTIVKEIDALRWVINHKYNGKIPKSIREAITDIHTLI